MCTIPVDVFRLLHTIPITVLIAEQEAINSCFGETILVCGLSISGPAGLECVSEEKLPIFPTLLQLEKVHLETWSK